MKRFVKWFNRKDDAEGLVRAGLAHLWFVTIHPFEDGNGRVARAIADQALAQSERVLNRYLDGFEGKLTAKKWAAIGKCSIPTAQRDINALIERDILRRNPGGSKNTSYELAVAP